MAGELERAIPHRAPFLLVDRVVSLTAERIRAARHVRADDELFSRVFAGHYPGSPIVPGVLLCEMVFQAGAILVSRDLRGEADGVPVLVRIRDARFKRTVHPGDHLVIEAEIVDRIGTAVEMKGSVLKEGARVLRVEFTCAVVPSDALSAD